MASLAHADLKALQEPLVAKVIVAHAASLVLLVLSVPPVCKDLRVSKACRAFKVSMASLARRAFKVFKVRLDPWVSKG
jgi:uncharacterized membrane protein YGL010W